jgi:hypothetical protein
MDISMKALTISPLEPHGDDLWMDLTVIVSFIPIDIDGMVHDKAVIVDVGDRFALQLDIAVVGLIINRKMDAFERSGCRNVARHKEAVAHPAVLDRCGKLLDILDIEGLAIDSDVRKVVEVAEI